MNDTIVAARKDIKYEKADKVLQAVIGEELTTFPQAFQLVSDYIDDNNLIDKEDSVKFETDSKLRPLFGGKSKVAAESIGMVVLDHLSKTDIIANHNPATYLLTWNPNRYPWDEISQQIDEIHKLGSCLDAWSCGNTKKIRIGDRIFLHRQGKDPKGIVASGTAESNVIEQLHWDPVKANRGVKARYVYVAWEMILDPPNKLPLSRDYLLKKVSKVNWDTQTSGIRISAEDGHIIDELWNDHLFSIGFVGTSESSYVAEEVDSTVVYSEGAVAKITVNAYERNSAARKKCIEYYGYDCYICGFNFGDIYGQEGDKFIHVHHLIPLSDVGRRYEVDPVKDLRPVCPNCHAIIHIKKGLSYSIDEVKLMIKNSQQ